MAPPRSRTDMMSPALGSDMEIRDFMNRQRTGSKSAPDKAESAPPKNSRAYPPTGGQLTPQGRDNIDKLVLEFKRSADTAETDSDNEEGEDREKPIVDGHFFNVGVGFVIALNAIVIGLETNAQTENEESVSVLWYLLEIVFCLFFLVEQILRVNLQRPNRLAYFFPVSARILNNFDFIIVWVSLVDTFILIPAEMGGSFRYAAMLRFVRLFRLVRLLRLFRIFKELWLVASGMIQALKTLVWICLITFVFMYICAIFCTLVIGHDDKTYDRYFMESDGHWDHEIYFKTVGRSCFTLFQVMTLDGWSEDIARHVTKNHQMMRYFFVVFLAVTNFGLLNIVVGVVVESAIATASRDSEKMKKAREKARKVVFSQLREIFEIADIDGSGTLTLIEVEIAINKPEIYNKLKMIDFPVDNPKQIFMLLDYDESGELSIEEFITGCIRMKGTANSKDLLVAQVAVDCMRKKYEKFEEQLVLFEEKLKSLDATARSIVGQGEHVFMDIRQYRVRHPEVKGNTMPRLGTRDLDNVPWGENYEPPPMPPTPPVDYFGRIDTGGDVRRNNSGQPRSDGPFFSEKSYGLMDHHSFENMLEDIKGTSQMGIEDKQPSRPEMALPPPPALMDDVNMATIEDNRRPTPQGRALPHIPALQDGI